MANYSYKDLCYSIPAHYEDTFEDRHGSAFDGDPNYNGDYWVVASEYVEDLENRIAEYKALINIDGANAIDKLEELANKEVWED